MARVSISSSKGPFCVQKYAFLAFSPKDPGAKFFRQLIPKGLAQTFPTVYETPMMYFFSPSLPSPPLCMVGPKLGNRLNDPSRANAG